MRVLVAIFVLTTVLTVKAIHHNQLAHGEMENNCLKETGTRRDDFNKAFDNPSNDVDMNIKCTTKCLLKGHEIIKDDGTVDIKEAVYTTFYDDRDKLDSPMAVNVIESCIQRGNNECENAHGFFICLANYRKKYEKERKKKDNYF